MDLKRMASMALALLAGAVAVAHGSAESNGVLRHPPSLGPEAGRLIVGFRAVPGNMDVKTIPRQAGTHPVVSRQARSSGADVLRVAEHAHLGLVASRQLTPSMHVVFLPTTLYGAAVDAALAALRADPSVAFADVDQRRYPHAVPDDPLFSPSANATGQWFMLTPNPLGDAAATDAVSAWNLTTGSAGSVIADVDTGVLFDHPDLLRAGLGGRLLPGYDFVSQDLDPTTGAALGTFLIANDGDGWDPDASDPGDWISTSDQSNALFPAKNCTASNSSWHGTRVMGMLGALSNNGVGVAGMTWNPYLLPVRALGKCGGYDSDIITGMQWAAGMSITGVPDNPYPADIINLSLGGTGACSTAYGNAVRDLTAMGVLIVASAGNESGPVDAPANCPGVLGVAGLRNVGTKVGYSSLGAEVGVAAPAGNCVNGAGLPCLKSIDTTSNTGVTTPGANTYTDQINPNLGTSFAAPIVTGVAALMHAANANLTPPQLIARLEASASPFPQPAGIPVCPAATSTGECACPNDHSQCGAGMLNALSAVMAALRPIAAVRVPVGTGAGATAVLDATGSAAACGHTLTSYSWSATPSSLIQSSNGAQVTVVPTGAGTLNLTVTDDAGAVDSASLSVSSGGVISKSATTPDAAGSHPCLGTLAVSPVAPTVAAAFAPSSVAQNAVATLTITLGNANAFDLSRASLTESLPANLSVAATSAPTTTCGGAAPLRTTATSVTLAAAVVPAKGICTITVSVQSAATGSYSNTLGIGALTTGPAGGNTVGASAALTVTAPASHGGGGALDGWDTLFVVGVLLAGRRRPKRRPPP